MSESQNNRRPRKSRRVFWALTLLLVLGIGIGLAVVFGLWDGCVSDLADGEECPIALLDVEDIKFMQLMLKSRTKDDPPTVIRDKETMVQILDAIKPAARDRFPAKWVSLGVLYIMFEDEELVEVCLYQTYEEEAAFSINRTCYRGGSEKELLNLLECGDLSPLSFSSHR